MENSRRRTSRLAACGRTKRPIFVESPLRCVIAKTLKKRGLHLGSILELREEPGHCLKKSGAPAGMKVKERSILVKSDEFSVEALFAKVDKAHWSVPG